MDEAIKRVKELNVDWSKYNIDKDANAFKEALESLNGIKHIIKIMTYSIMIGGLAVLSLILILWLRERIYEIGILLSIGVSKIKIIAQFIMELILISLPTIVISLIFGNLAVNQIVEGLVNSDDTTSITSNFLSNGYTVDSLITFMQSYLALPSDLEVLVRAAIVKTFAQIDAVHKVSFMIDEEPLKDSNNNIIGTMDSVDRKSVV